MALVQRHCAGLETREARFSIGGKAIRRCNKWLLQVLEVSVTFNLRSRMSLPDRRQRPPIRTGERGGHFKFQNKNSNSQFRKKM
ncbi:hypothetical protein EVAR_91751_1 [Eumeta japonica]|uniref:Uncharacterized protein n=1 Tax=Eumeta variegata TaxID=151549 RepID=A0A4C1THA8_EUMVA|nr:hypothetical protein EVAR_91751_1 [Eumeta japonica]